MASLQSLLANSIDYAGLFPPCSLDLGRALENQSRYVRMADRWMLSTFVLPLAKFGDTGQYFRLFDADHPLRISALGPATDTAKEFDEAISKLEKGMQSLISDRRLAVLEQLEMALPKTGANEGLLNDIRKFADTLSFPTFWEAPATKAPETISLLADHNARHERTRPLGFKLRTGGVTAEAFPSPTDMAKALVAATSKRVPVKFTAGLHHPVRQFRDEVRTKMYGFLNVLGAGVMAAEHGWGAEQCAAMLQDEDPSHFRFSDDSFSWGDWSINSTRIEQHRKLITSFGSCSFDEPREDLQQLQLLAVA